MLNLGLRINFAKKQFMLGVGLLGGCNRIVSKFVIAGRLLVECSIFLRRKNIVACYFSGRISLGSTK